MTSSSTVLPIPAQIIPHSGPMPTEFPRSMRRAYREWVEEQIEQFKDTVPRSTLLDLADEVCRELRVDQAGQYQLTEVLLCTAMDRRIFRLMKLPGYRAWCAQQEVAAAAPAEPAMRARVAVGRIAAATVQEGEPEVCVA